MPDVDKSAEAAKAEAPKTEAAKKKDGGWFELIRTVFYAVLIALVVRTFAYEPFNIPSGSMKPTLLIGDYLFVSKFAYGYSKYSLPTFGIDLFEGRIFGSDPERGDVAVFRKPTEPDIDFIKRIIGLPGDRIQMIDGLLHINDQPVDLTADGEFIDETCSRSREVPQFIETLPNGVSHLVLNEIDGHYLDTTEVYLVPEGHFFAMGDNRDQSSDSRVASVGFIPAENLIGRAEIIFFSADTCGSLYNPLTWPSSIRWGRLFMSIE